MADISKINLPNGNEYDIKDSTARSDISSLETSVNAKLPLSGGTMSGAIYKENSNVDLKESDNGVTATTYDGPIMLRDKNDYNICGVRGVVFTDGKTRGEIKVYNRQSDNTQVEAGFGINIDKTGTITYSVSKPGALLAAINAADKFHAVDASTYGLGTTSVYGHVKTVNNLTTSAHEDGLALSAYQGKVLKTSIDAVDTAVDGKAPKSHASSATTYGLGTSSSYGHVKIVNNVTTSAHTNGLALSAYQGKVLKDAIDTLDTAVDGKAPKSHASSATTYGLGTTANYGHVKTVNNLTTEEHASGLALSAYQGHVLSNSISALTDSVNAKLPKSGGTMTGNITMGSNLVYSAETLHLRGNKFLNLRSPGIQCRNAVDTGWAGISASTFTTQSSERYKEKIELANDDIANTVYGLNVKTYDYKENVVEEHYRRNRVGLLAEELIRDIPEVVSLTTDENGNEIPEGIDYAALVPYLLKTIQVQHEDIQILYEALTELAGIVSEE